MARRLFGTRKGNVPPPPPAINWPQLPGGVPPMQDADGSLPILTSALSADMPDAAEAQISTGEELLERIAAFRAAVADSLYESSKDYQILSNLRQADLTACDDIIEELRRRLAGNIHFRVLDKLDEVHAMVATHNSEPLPPRSQNEG